MRFCWPVAVARIFALLVVTVSGWNSGSLLAGETFPEPDGHTFSIRWLGRYTHSTSFDSTAGRGAAAWLARLFLGDNSLHFRTPFGLAAAPSGDIWVLDQGAGVPFRIHPDAGRMERLSIPDGEPFPSLVDVAIAADGAAYFTDSRLGGVYCVAPGTATPRAFVSPGSLQRPTGIAVDPVSGRPCVVETAAHRIAILNADGSVHGTFGGRGDTPGRFNFPSYLTIDVQGRLYVVDAMNFRVQILDSVGTPIGWFGQIGDGSGDFARPKGIALDSHGHIYVVDALFGAVQVFDGEGRLLTTFGRRGQGDGEFWMPTGIAIDSRDRIFVADGHNHCVQVFQLTGGSGDE